MIRARLGILLTLLLAALPSSYAAESLSLDALLEKVKAGRVQDSQENAPNCDVHGQSITPERIV